MLIEIVNNDGKNVWVNPTSIEEVREGDDKLTWLRYGKGGCVESTKESLDSLTGRVNTMTYGFDPLRFPPRQSKIGRAPRERT